MGTRSVKLDEEAEKALEEVMQATGLSASAAVKQGLRALRQQLSRQGSQSPYGIYDKLDLGPGGYAIAPSTRTKDAVREAIRKKLGR
jgi:Arc/MetJ-type ribon-helix-helix transcriptional regulator